MMSVALWSGNWAEGVGRSDCGGGGDGDCVDDVKTMYWATKALEFKGNVEASSDAKVMQGQQCNTKGWVQARDEVCKDWVIFAEMIEKRHRDQPINRYIGLRLDNFHCQHRIFCQKSKWDENRNSSIVI